MTKIDLKNILELKIPDFFKKYPKVISSLFVRFLERSLRIKHINHVFELLQDKTDFDFIREFFKYLNFTYVLSNGSQKKIPPTGKLICVANHPLGGLDGLALLNAIGEIRRDVKVVTNELLVNLKNISNLFLPYDIYSTKAQRDKISGIIQVLDKNGVIILFPGASVARMTFFGIRELPWQNGAIHLSQKYNIPILPIHVNGKNSWLYYFLSFFNPRLSSFFLGREVFLKRAKSIKLTIGNIIPPKEFEKGIHSYRQLNNLLKEHVLRIGKNKPGIFKTVSD